MDDVTSERCRALLGAAHSDEPNADSLHRTAAALGIQAAVITTAATASAQASGAVQLSAAKAAAGTTAKAAAVATSAKGAGNGLSVAALGASNATVKLVSVAVLVAGGVVGVVGVAQLDGRMGASHAPEPAVRQTPNGPALPPGATGVAPVARDSVPNPEGSSVPSAEAGKSEYVIDERRETLPQSATRETQRKRTNTRVSSRPDMSPNPLEREVALLSKARVALMTSNPDEALKWLDEYQRQFASGMLRHEAGVLRARARDAKRLRP